MVRQGLIILVLISGFFLSWSQALAGTVLNAHKYAWSNNSGYINFSNTTVTDSTLSGYAWSANHGWINLNPAQGGVRNDGNGNLSGSAWGAQLGWIDFDNVSINTSTGKFSGTATGSLVGTITFSCTRCDVETDWRPTVTSVVAPVTASPGSLGILAAMSYVNTSNTPLIVDSTQEGTVVQDTNAGKVVLEIAKNSVSNKTTFVISEELLSSTNEYLVVGETNLIGAGFYNISAIDENGKELHFFQKPITITLPVPAGLVGVKNLAVYWLNETNWQWVLIPDAIFSNGKATFKVDHLTKFAIFATPEPVSGITIKQEPSIELPIEKKELYKKEQAKVATTSVATTTVEVTGKAVREISVWNWFLTILAFTLLIFLARFINRNTGGFR